MPDPPGAGPLAVEVALQRGIWIEGKVTEKATGKAGREARLHYLPFLENTFAQAHPVFDKNGNTDGVGFQDRYQTKADGTFRLVGLPGRAIVGAVVHDKPFLQGAGSEAIKGMNKSGHFETYRNPINPWKLWPTVMKEINPPADAKVVHVDLQVTTGPSVRFTVVDPDGKPIAGLKTSGRSGRSSYDREDMTKPEAEVTNLMPDEERIVLLRHEGRKLGKVVRSKRGTTRTGRSSSSSNRWRRSPAGSSTPMATRSQVQPSGPTCFPAEISHSASQQVATDSDGRFRVPDVPTGCDYGLAVETAYRSREASSPSMTKLPSSPARRPTSARSSSRQTEDRFGSRRRLVFMNTSPWAPYRPSDAAPWNLDRAWTLRRRAGFAATWAELERDLAERPRPGRRPRARRRVPHRGRSRRLRQDGRLLGDAAAGSSDPRRLQAWWLYRVLFTPDPLRTTHARLARPLRDQPAQGRRRRGDAAAERDVSAPRPRPVRRPAAGRCSATRPCSSGSTHRRTARASRTKTSPAS